jgi:hypothetical protein
MKRGYNWRRRKRVGDFNLLANVQNVRKSEVLAKNEALCSNCLYPVGK